MKKDVKPIIKKFLMVTTSLPTGKEVKKRRLLYRLIATNRHFSVEKHITTYDTRMLKVGF